MIWSSLAQIRAQVETGNVHWDVADAVLDCEECLMMYIDPGPTAERGRQFREGRYRHRHAH